MPSKKIISASPSDCKIRFELAVREDHELLNAQLPMRRQNRECAPKRTDRFLVQT